MSTTTDTARFTCDARSASRRLPGSLACGAALALALVFCLVAAAPVPAYAQSCGTLEVEGTGFSFDAGQNVLAIDGGARVTVSSREEAGGAGDTCIVVRKGGGAAEVTLEGVSIDKSASASGCAFQVESGASVRIVLAKGSSNSLSSGADRAGLEAPSGASVHISGEGSLVAQCNGMRSQANGAGIGGGMGASSGDIEISGGKVSGSCTSRDGDANGAGIGGGATASGGTVRISGGTVSGSCVTLGGNAKGAGIGGGIGGGAGIVSISGGTVTGLCDGSSNSHGAGIGGGYWSAAGTVEISGGKVEGWCGDDVEGGADIGGGFQGGSGNGSVTIYGGTVKADLIGVGDASVPDAFIDVHIRSGFVSTYEFSQPKHTWIHGGAFTNGNVSKNTVHGKTVEEGCTVMANPDPATKKAYPYLVEPNLEELEVAGGTPVIDYDCNGQAITVTSSKPLTISMKPGVTTSYAGRIVVKAGTQASLTLDGVSIEARAFGGCAFRVEPGAEADITLKEGTTSALKSSSTRAGLEVPGGATASISGTGRLAAESAGPGPQGAGIGGGQGEAAGVIGISNGHIKALGVVGIGNGVGASGELSIAITGGAFAEGDVGGQTVYGVSPQPGHAVVANPDPATVGDYPVAVAPQGTLELNDPLGFTYDGASLEASDIVKTAQYGEAPPETGDLEFRHCSASKPGAWNDGLPKDVGTYEVKATLKAKAAGGVSYLGNEKTATVEIAQAEGGMDLELSKSEATYGDKVMLTVAPKVKAPAANALALGATPTPTVTAYAGGEVLATTTENVAEGKTATLLIDTHDKKNLLKIDTNTIIVKVAGLSNLKEITGTATLKVNKKQLGIEWANYEDRVYNDGKQVRAAITSGVVSPDDVSVKVSGGDETEAGTYAATATLEGADAGFYRLPDGQEEREYSIAKAAISPAPSAKAELPAYDAEKEVEVDLSELLPDDAGGAPAYEVRSKTGNNLGSAEVDASTGKLTLKSAGKGAEALDMKDAVEVSVTGMGNYEDATAEVEVSYADRPVAEIQGVQRVEASDYDGEPHQGFAGTPTATYAGGEYAGAFDIKYEGTLASGEKYDSVDAPTAAGSYTVTISVPESVVTCTGSSEPLSFDIEQAKLTASVDSSSPSASKAYDGTPDFAGVALTLENALSADDVSATADGTAASADAGEGLAFAAKKVDLAGADAANYALDLADVGGTVSIAQADGVLEVEMDGSATYGDNVSVAVTPKVKPAANNANVLAATKPEVSVWLGEEKLASGAAVENQPTTLSFTAGKRFAMGDNALTIKVTGLSNLKEIADTKTLAVKQKELGIEWKDWENRVYNDGKEVGAAITSGVVSPDDDVSVQVADGNKTEVGTYTATASLTGADKDRYKLPEGKGSRAYTIAKAAISPAPSAEAELPAYDAEKEAEVDLSELLPDDAGGAPAYEVRSKTGNNLGSAEVDAGTGVLTLKSAGKGAEALDMKDAVEVSVTGMGNYEDATAEVEVSYADRPVAEIQGATADSATYDGNQHPGFAGAPKAVWDGGAYAGPFSYEYEGTLASGEKYGSVDAPTAAGSYTVTISVPESVATCTGSSEPLPFDIEQAKLTASVDSSSPSAAKAYDGTPAFSKVKLDLFNVVEPDEVSATADGEAASADAGEGLAFAAKKVELSGADAANYALDASDVGGTVSIAQADGVLEVSMDGSATYGDNVSVAVTPKVKPAANGINVLAATKPEVSIWLDDEKLASGDAVENQPTTLTFTAGKSFAMGDNALTVKVTGLSNLKKTTGTTTLTVNPKQLGIEWKDWENRVYNDGKEVGAAISGKVSQDDDVFVQVADGDKTEVGTYTAVATLTGADKDRYKLPDGEGAKEYAIVQADGILEVSMDGSAAYGDTVTVAVTPKVKPAANGANLLAATKPEVSVWLGDEKLASGDAVENQPTTLSFTAGKRFAMGDNALTIKVTGLSNLKEIADAKTLTVKPRELGIEWKDWANRVYKDGKEVGATISGKIEGDDVSVQVADGNKKDVGTYTATASLTGADKDRYKLPEDKGSQAYTIAQADGVLEVSMDSAAVYGDAVTVAVTPKVKPAANGINVLAATTPEVSIWLDGEKLASGDAVENQPTELSFTADKRLAIGDNDLTIKVTGLANLKETTDTKTLTVNAKQLDIQWGNYESRVYKDGKEVTATISGKVSKDDDVSVEVTDGNKTEVGTYTATASLAGADKDRYKLPEDKDVKEYAIVQADGVLEVSMDSAAAYGDTVTVAVTPKVKPAANGANLLAATKPEVSVWLGEEKLASGDAVENQPTALSFTADKRLAMGENSLTIKVTGLANLKEIIDDTKTLTVNAKQLDIQWDNYESRVYKDGKEVTATISGKVSRDDDVSVEVTDGNKTEAGTHTATASLTGADKDRYKLPEGKGSQEYSIAQADGILEVSMDSSATYGDTVSVTVTPKVKPAANGANLLAATKPEVSVWLGEEKLASGDAVENQKTTLSFTADKRFAMGENSLTIKVTGLSNLKEIADAKTLTVKPKELGIEWKDWENRVYNDGKEVGAAISGGLGGDDVSVQVAGGNETEAGTYAATAALAGADKDRYKLPEGKDSRAYTIEKAESHVAVTPGEAAVAYGDAVELSVTPEIGPAARGANGLGAAAPTATAYAGDPGEGRVLATTTADVAEGKAAKLTIDTHAKKDLLAMGENTITVVATGLPNLGDASAEVKLTVNPIELGIEWGNYENRVYNDGLGPVTAELTDAPVKVLKGDDVTLSCEGLDATEAGAYTATAALTGADAGRYRLPAGKDALDFAVAQAQSDIKLDVDTQATVYGDTAVFNVIATPREAATASTASVLEAEPEPIEPKATAYLGTSAEGIELASAPIEEGEQAALVISTSDKRLAMGGNLITIAVTGLPNLENNEATATLTVNPKPVSLAWEGIEGRVYGDGGVVTASVDDVLEGDDVRADVAGGGETQAGGPYTASAALAGDDAARYAIAGSTSAQYSIAKAAAPALSATAELPAAEKKSASVDVAALVPKDAGGTLAFTVIPATYSNLASAEVDAAGTLALACAGNGALDGDTVQVAVSGMRNYEDAVATVAVAYAKPTPGPTPGPAPGPTPGPEPEPLPTGDGGAGGGTALAPTGDSLASLPAALGVLAAICAAAVGAARRRRA